MPVALPTELILHIVQNIPIAVHPSGKKEGWDYIRGLSIASHSFRHLALQRWFRTLRVGRDIDSDDWVDVITLLPGVLDFVQKLHLTREGWLACFDMKRSIFDPTMTTRIEIVGLRKYPRQVLASLSHLESVRCDLEESSAYRTLLDNLTDVLPSTVTSLEMFHGKVPRPGIFKKVLQNLPNLRRLDLGACRSHCPCNDCVNQAEWVRSFEGTTAMFHCVYLIRNGVGDLIAQGLPQDSQVEFISFNSHLTLYDAYDTHISQHDKRLPMYQCDSCIEAGHSDVTLAAETAGAEALARALPMLKVVEWCSYFCESGKSRQVIHRTDTGDIQVEAADLLSSQGGQ